MVSQSLNGFPKYGFSIIKWFPKIWFLNQKMVYQNMVSQSFYGFPKYGFSIKKWNPYIFPLNGLSIKKWNPYIFPLNGFSIILWYSSRGFHHIYKNIMIYMFFQTYESWGHLNYW